MENMTLFDWMNTYKPIPNHIDEDSDLDGRLFGLHGDELIYVDSMDINNVWTVLDVDDSFYIVNGFHYVNRAGYLISAVPFADGADIEVKTILI